MTGPRILTAFQMGALVLASAALYGCAATTVSPIPQARPAVVTPAVVPAAPQSAQRMLSQKSLAMRKYYENVQADFLRNDLLRTDGGGVDTPFNEVQLTRNFDAIALNDEYATIGGQFVAQTTRSTLHRWEIPVRIGLEFGESVPNAQRAIDRATVTALTARLARATRHPISMSSQPNFHVLVLNEDERQAIGPRLFQLVPGIGQSMVNSIVDMPRSSYCVVVASDPDDNGAYTKAVAIIRGEHPDLMRMSCFHEEIAQGLGLANDSPRARPSIFNDDEEFALLTRHDELLLQMLYDPRLHIGMSPEIAGPISAQIAREILGQNS
ncbi:DUF2927 family protein [Pacificibacter maritimus]|uniref:DUF2927 family protein n=1 Tax=Pacificibacter maritimus TaxID=762213 RepID=A0A3N4UN86_9RHOB|nr:DUF2927 domain-containing protein [Pacificibacter maritimus]RPE72082.1 DUF2927 family protein [Pacificibacter maritimus]